MREQLESLLIDKFRIIIGWLEIGITYIYRYEDFQVSISILEGIPTPTPTYRFTMRLRKLAIDTLVFHSHIPYLDNILNKSYADLLKGEREGRGL